MGQQDPLEKGVTAHSSILAWRIPWTEEPGGYSPQGGRELDMTERLTVSINSATILEKEMTTQSSILAWKIPWTEEPGGLLSMELQELDTT